MKVRTDEIDGRANKAAGALRHSRKHYEKHPSHHQHEQGNHLTNAMNAIKKAKDDVGVRDESIDDDVD